MTGRDGPSVRLETGAVAPGVAELVFDAPGRPVNVLSMPVVDELDQALDAVAHDGSVRALLVRSGKPDSFIAGADVTMLQAIPTSIEAEALCRRGHRAIARLAEASKPIVAAVHGAALGGGFELALACRVRLASDAPHTRLGLPEVKLGLIPGFGGTQRLPRLVGVRRATGMILKGYALGAREAARAGLVDLVLPESGFLEAARSETLRLARGERRVRRPRLALADRVLEVVGPARDLYFLGAERSVRRQTRGNYPAPEKAIESLREGLRASLDEGLEIEAGLVGALAVSPECKGLVRVFFLSEANRKDPGADLGLARPVHKLGVVGAGVMGAGIAALGAAGGLPVRLRDVSLDAVARGMERVAADVDRWSRRTRADRRERERALRRIAPTTGLTGFRRAEVVIEAAVEDLALKRDVLETLEEVMAPEAVFATNTSALSISELQRSARRPERVVGMHFFNPVAKMPLVEVVRGDATSEAAVATVVRLARDLGKVAVVVADGPGFLVNRILGPYLGEALVLVMDGVDPPAIDQAMVDFGMPMGPLELLDEVGLDVAEHVSATLRAAFPDRLLPSPLLRALVAQGRLGRKSGLGFYRHAAGRRVLDSGLGRITRGLGIKPRRDAPPRGRIQERLVLAMVNEAARALEEGIVRSPGECDLAMVLGTGFPPFRGGLFAFAATLGVEPVLASLERLESECGERYRPAPLIEALARKGRGFLDARDVLA